MERRGSQLDDNSNQRVCMCVVRYNRSCGSERTPSVVEVVVSMCLLENSCSGGGVYEREKNKRKARLGKQMIHQE